MRLIGLHARYHAGKDTAYEIIDRQAIDDGRFAIRRALADPLKVSGLRALGIDKALGIDPSATDELVGVANLIKETGHIVVSWETPSGALRAVPLKGRQFWQWYGTEAHREEDLGSSFGRDFWVDNLLPLGVDNAERPLFWQNFKESWAGFADFAVVTDVRFENEAQRILDLDGEVWWINAEERLGENTEQHESEQRLPDHLITRTIDNNSTLGNLEQNVLDALKDGDPEEQYADD